MVFRCVPYVALLLTMSLSTGYGQEAPTVRDSEESIAGFRVQVWAYRYFGAEALQEFYEQLRSYVEFRSHAARGLPRLRITRNPADLRQAQKLLADRIRKVRAAAARGEIFVRPIETGVKHLLIVELDQTTLKATSGDNPGEFVLEVNSTYPEGLPLSTMPPKILAMLPAVDEDVEYRFVGRHLILRDARANVVIDHIPYAIDCRDCEQLIEGDNDDEEEEE